jgi:hypothetical protein
MSKELSGTSHAAQPWRNSAVFAASYFFFSLFCTVFAVFLGWLIDSNFVAVNIGDIMWKFAIDLLTPFTNVLLVIFVPSAWWLGLTVLTFIFPVAADGYAVAPGSSREGYKNRLATVLSGVGMALNLAVIANLIIGTFGPDQPIGGPIYPVLSSLTPAIAASLAFAALLVSTLRRKPDKL